MLSVHVLFTDTCISTPLTRKGLMQKTRHLMDNNRVSFQMFLIQLSFTAVASESQISVD